MCVPVLYKESSLLSYEYTMWFIQTDYLLSVNTDNFTKEKNYICPLMRSIIVLALLAIVSVLQSCTEDVDTLAPYKEVCVIWSFLDKSETDHYIVVQKGFVNPSLDANKVAQNPDSLFFDNAVVKLEESANGSTINTYTLTQVDLVQEGIQKDTGIFARQPNYAYKYSGTLNPSYTYTLVVEYNGKTYSASTPVLDIDASDLNIYGLQWTDSSKSIFFTPSQAQKIFWNSPSGGAIYDAYLNISYFDVFDSKPTDTIRNVMKWRVIDKERFRDITSMQAFLTYDELSYALLAGIPKAVAGQKRYIGYLTLEFYCGSQRLVNYLTLADAKGGIAANQVTPDFVEGFNTEDTYGLFDSRSQVRGEYLKFSDSTIYYLRFLPETSSLNIKGQIAK